MQDKLLKTARVTRLARIFCNISLFCGIVLMLLGLMPVIKVIYFIFAAVIVLVATVAWLVSLILVHPFDLSVVQSIIGSDAIFNRIQVFSLKFAPYMCAVAVVLGAVSIPLILLNKSVPAKGRIVAASIAMGLAVVGLIALYLGVYL